MHCHHPAIPQCTCGGARFLRALLLLVLASRSSRAADEKAAPTLKLTGHVSAVYTVAFSPDGKRLASGSNREVIVWDLSAGKELFTYRITGTNVFGLAFTPDGKQLAVGISKMIKILDAATGKEEAAVGGAAHFLFRMTYSPDGKRLAASGGSSNSTGELCVWDVATRQAVLRLAPPAGAVLNVAYSADGRRLAIATGAMSGTRPGEVSVWEAADCRDVVTLHGHTDNVYGVAFSPDGRHVASASGARGAARPGEVKLWEVLSGKEVLNLTGHVGPVFAVAYSPNGRLLATASGDRTVRLWEAANGREIRSLAGHGGIVYSVAFSPDGKHLASAGSDRAVTIWDVPAQRPAAAERLDTKQTLACWDALRGDDARKAYRAVGLLASSPKESVPFLRAQVRPAAPLQGEERKRVERWLRDLDDDNFEQRQQATEALLRLGQTVLPAARKTLAGNPSAEVRRRLEYIVEKVVRLASSPDGLAALRAVEALEQAATVEARGLLKELAAGLPGAELTSEANAALGRLIKVGENH
jgi:WD40 repeat protein